MNIIQGLMFGAIFSLACLIGRITYNLIYNNVQKSGEVFNDRSVKCDIASFPPPTDKPKEVKDVREKTME